MVVSMYLSEQLMMNRWKEHKYPSSDYPIFASNVKCCRMHSFRRSSFSRCNGEFLLVCIVRRCIPVNCWNGKFYCVNSLSRPTISSLDVFSMQIYETRGKSTIHIWQHMSPRVFFKRNFRPIEFDSIN